MAVHIVFARQRSGTGALGSMLDQHQDICYLGELFHPDENARNENYFNFLLEQIQNDPQRGLPSANELNYREFMAHIERLQDKKNVLVDVKYINTHHFNGNWHSPLDMPKFIQFCKQDNRKIIHLKRRNFLKKSTPGSVGYT